MSDFEKDPIVGVIMGSDSDLPTMMPASRMLSKFEVAHETRVISAHRTPERMADYAREAEERGLQVIIAAAGGSAHLQGMTASETILPVLGVAVESSADTLNSALGSMIRMPEGIPLATMGKGAAGAANAALEAIRIIALRDTALRDRYRAYVEELAASVIAKDDRLRQIGPEAYFDQMMANKA